MLSSHLLMQASAAHTSLPPHGVGPCHIRPSSAQVWKLRSSTHCLTPGLQICSGPVVDELELLLVSPLEVLLTGPVESLVALLVVFEALVLEVPGSVLVTGFVVVGVDIVAEPLPLSLVLVGDVAVLSDVAELDCVALAVNVVAVVAVSVSGRVPSSPQAATRSVRPRNLPGCVIVISERRMYPGRRGGPV